MTLFPLRLNEDVEKVPELPLQNELETGPLVGSSSFVVEGDNSGIQIRPVEITPIDPEIIQDVMVDMNTDNKESSGKKIPDKFINLKLLSLNPIEISSLLPVTINSVLDNSDFSKGLDKIDSDLEFMAKQAEKQNKVISDITFGVVMSLTAGIVSWILRAGTLLASFMSIVPLWTQFDPVPVLGGAKKKDKDDEVEDGSADSNDERVESFFTSNDSD